VSSQTSASTNAHDGGVSYQIVVAQPRTGESQFEPVVRALNRRDGPVESKPQRERIAATEPRLGEKTTALEIVNSEYMTSTNTSARADEVSGATTSSQTNVNSATTAGQEPKADGYDS